MRSKVLITAGSLVLSVALLGCTKSEVGTATGAVVGGLVGSQFGAGTGRVVATGVGAAAGAVVGKKLSE